MYHLPACVRRVQQVLQSAAHLKWCRMKVAQKLSPHHRTARLRWAREQLANTHPIWPSILWSDEKRFNLEGPDGFGYYRADKRLPKAMFSRHQNGGGCIMIWGMFSARDCADIVKVEGNINSQTYIGILQDCVVIICECRFPRSTLFQQDIAPAHTAHATTQFLVYSNVDLLPWLAYAWT